MKKLFVTCLAVLLIMSCFAVSASAEGGSPATISNVVDTAGILSEPQLADLEEKAEAISEKYQCSVYIIVVNDFTRYTNSRDIYDLAVEMYSQYSLGWDNGNGDSKRDSLVLLMSMEDRDFALDTNGYIGNRAFNEPGMFKLEQAMLPFFRQNDWYGGYKAFLDCAEDLLISPLEENTYVPQTTQVIQHGYENPNGRRGNPLFILAAVFVPMLIAFIVCSSFKRQMVTAVEKTNAGGYIVPPGINMRVRRDDFVNRTVTRTVIHHDSGPRDSGGGFSGGGHFSGGHSGHSGKF
ncbi:MAG: TPM domain-containing protein [Oscillospiraceae bacterium]|nr:TPM domain-containing protein [Oscillospiraceae bacterium]